MHLEKSGCNRMPFAGQLDLPFYAPAWGPTPLCAWWSSPQVRAPWRPVLLWLSGTRPSRVPPTVLSRAESIFLDFLGDCFSWSKSIVVLYLFFFLLNFILSSLAQNLKGARGGKLWKKVAWTWQTHVQPLLPVSIVLSSPGFASIWLVWFSLV